jgi:hypothetical protein
MDKMDKYLNIPQEEQNNFNPDKPTKGHSFPTLSTLPITSATAHYDSALTCPYLARALPTLPNTNPKQQQKLRLAGGVVESKARTSKRSQVNPHAVAGSCLLLLLLSLVLSVAGLRGRLLLRTVQYQGTRGTPTKAK